MEKIALVILLLGAALLSYGPVTEMLKTSNDLESCSCKNIEDLVAEAEGKRKCVYKDTKGIPTIGIGFNLKRSDAPGLIKGLGLDYSKVVSGKQCLNDHQISSLFNHDLKWASAGAKKCIPSFSTHHKCIQEVLIDMTFNMGANALCSWTHFKDQLAHHQYSSAASNMKSTLWCKQVKSRCTRNTSLVSRCG